jgi:hypothetical protein
MGGLRLTTGAGLLLALPIVVVPSFGAGVAPPAGADTTTTLFSSSTPSYTSGAATTVPQGICFVTVNASGGSGGDGDNPNGINVAGGAGATVNAHVPVTPGDVLGVVVGGAGGFVVSADGGNGGLGGGGGGANGGGGGGASVVTTGMGTPLVVAGGGGGSGTFVGGAAGAPGSSGSSSSGGGIGGSATGGGGEGGADGGGGGGGLTTGGGGASSIGGGGGGGVGTVGGGGGASGGAGAGGTGGTGSGLPGIGGQGFNPVAGGSGGAGTGTGGNGGYGDADMFSAGGGGGGNGFGGGGGGYGGGGGGGYGGGGGSAGGSSYVISSAKNASSGTHTGNGSVSITYDWTTDDCVTVVQPLNDSTLSGSTDLDASASNATSVEFLLFGGSYGFSAPVICTATLTLYGWVCSWNTTTVPNGSYTLVSYASGSGGSTASLGVSITVKNASPPTTSVLIPSKGATLSGTAATLDASASNATSVKFLLFGGSYGFNAPVTCTATLTPYGWYCAWNTTTVPDSSYDLVSEAFNTTGSTYSSGVGITVDN